MITISSTYLGELRVESTHVKSGNSLHTDAPIDNHGKGETFSPTDLMCTALASCMMTIMGIEANKLGIDLKGTTLKTTKYMSVSPRKVSKVKIDIEVHNPNISEAHQDLLRHAALTCPVALSLHPDLVQEVEIKFA
ncbi:MAG: OsmC family protein [Cytophagales bacterium]